MKNTAINDSISSILQRISVPVSERGNIPAGVCTLKKELELYIKGVYTKKREAASFLILFIISDKLR